MKTSRFLSIVFLSVLTFSCKDTGTNPGLQNGRKFYLEKEYVNFAWGYSHNGRFVDTGGAIISYDIAGSGTPWVSNPTGYYTEEELWAKIHHNDTVRGLVHADTLALLRGLAVGSLGGAFSDTLCPGADMGSFVYACYIFQDDSSKFQRIVLRVDGDCRYHNTSQCAIELATWLARM